MLAKADDSPEITLLGLGNVFKKLRRFLGLCLWDPVSFVNKINGSVTSCFFFVGNWR